MPLTPFQREVSRLLASQRNPESHIAGGAAINRSDASLRYSSDLDIFHEAADSVASSAQADADALTGAGLTLTWLLRQDGFHRAEARRVNESLRLDWTVDTAFRFFPVQPDDDFGYALHPADLAVNKVLALAGRSEIRDYLDTLYLDETYLSLGAMMWAACGKDPGYTPTLLLDSTNRHACYHDIDLKSEHLARPVDLRDLKKHWLSAREKAKALFEMLPEGDLGCLYVDAANQPLTPDPSNPLPLKRHFGSIRGAWPKISG